MLLEVLFAHLVDLGGYRHRRAEGDQQAVIHAAKVVYQLYADMFRGLPRAGEVSHASR